MILSYTISKLVRFLRHSAETVVSSSCPYNLCLPWLSLHVNNYETVSNFFKSYAEKTRLFWTLCIYAHSPF